MAVTIDKVIRVGVDYDDMRRLWGDNTYFNEYWATLDYIEENRFEYLLTDEEYLAIKNKKADFIAFYDNGAN